MNQHLSTVGQTAQEPASSCHRYPTLIPSQKATPTPIARDIAFVVTRAVRFGSTPFRIACASYQLLSNKARMRPSTEFPKKITSNQNANVQIRVITSLPLNPAPSYERHVIMRNPPISDPIPVQDMTADFEGYLLACQEGADRLSESRVAEYLGQPKRAEETPSTRVCHFCGVRNG